MSKIVLLILVMCLCILVKAKSDINKYSVRNEYARVKRAKYYSSPPTRFYRRSPSNSGYFSYTPPPHPMIEDEEPQYPEPKPSKVNRKPNNEDLSDNEINNIVKYLSKQDLDKIIEISNEKHGDKDMVIEFKDAPYRSKNPPPDLQSSYFGNIPFNLANQNKGDSFSANHFEESTEPRILNSKIYNQPHSIPFEGQESNRFAINDFIHRELNELSPDKGADNFYTDSKVMNDEILPKPVNLRDGDHEIAFTDVPVKLLADGSYKVESFADLPLMNYNSKLHTVNSYKVPHYTVLSTSATSSSSSSSRVKAPPVEPAPPPSAVRDQSDAHLKAIKIWTHRSKGTAYTLHDDGTLSIERPIPPKPKYGPYA